MVSFAGFLKSYWSGISRDGVDTVHQISDENERFGSTRLGDLRCCGGFRRRIITGGNLPPAMKPKAVWSKRWNQTRLVSAPILCHSIGPSYCETHGVLQSSVLKYLT
ncbi:hypothetical protein YC2023_029801 [Brassica napus]